MRPAPQLFRELAPLCAVLFPVSLLAPGSACSQTTLLVPGGASLAIPSPRPQGGMKGIMGAVASLD